MDHSIAPQTHVFKLNCPKCQKKVKKLLSRLNGVYSIKVDADAGRVTIKSTVNPDTLAATIGGIMKERDFSCEPLTPPPNNNVHVEQWINNVPVRTADNGNAHYKSQFKGYEVADLHELARAPRVKQLEFTQTRNIKMIFNDEKESGPSRPTAEPKKDSGPNHVHACAPSECHSHINAQHEVRPSRPTEEPKKDFGPNHLSACDPSESHSRIKAHHEPRKGGGPSYYYSAAPGECHELRNLPQFAHYVVNHSGAGGTPPSPHNHIMLPYHCYPLPSYYGRPPPLLPKSNDADMYCDNVSKCRMM